MGEMLFDDFDVDALLDAQSSDDDGNDLPELERSLDDILNDDDDEFADVLGHSLPVRLATGAPENGSFSSDQDTKENATFGLDRDLVETAQVGTCCSGEFVNELEKKTALVPVLPYQKEELTGDIELETDERDGQAEGKPKTEEPITQGLSGFVATGAEFQESGEVYPRAEDDGIELAEKRRGLAGVRTSSGSENNATPRVLSSSVHMYPVPVGSNSSRRPGAAFAAAAAASRHLGPAASAASKFAKAISTRQGRSDSEASDEKNWSQLQKNGNFTNADEVSDAGNIDQETLDISTELELSAGDLDNDRPIINDRVDTTEEDNESDLDHDQKAYAAVIEECMDKVENLSSTIANLEQQSRISRSSASIDVKENMDSDSRPRMAVGTEADSSSSKDASRSDEEGDSNGEREDDFLEQVILNSSSERNCRMEITEPESCDVDSLKNWIGDGHESVTTSTSATSDAQLHSRKTSSVRSFLDEGEGEEEASREELVQQLEEVGAGSQLAAQDVEEEPQRTALQIAEELERKAASSGLHWEEGAVAQPMRLEGIQGGAPAIGLLQLDSGGSLSFALKSAPLRREQGTPQALAVHTNFIAIGLSKGAVLIIPSKYSATRSADETDAKPYTLIPAASEKYQMGVSSMSFNQQGDLLLVGYSNGHIILWDVPKASVGRHIEKDNGVAIVHAVFVGQDVAASRTIRAITTDARGLTLLHAFSVIPVLRRFSLHTSVLLDGQRTGLVLSIAPLLPNEGINIPGGASAPQSGMSSSPINLGTVMSVVGGAASNDVGRKFLYDGASSTEEGGGLVVLATYQAALVVRLLPTLAVCARFPRPEGIRDVAIPYTAWRRIKAKTAVGTTSTSTSGNAPSAESMHSSPSKSSDGRSAENCQSRDEGPVEAGIVKANGDVGENLPLLAMAWDKKVLVLQLLKSELKITAQWNLDSAAIGVAWLEEQMMVVATSKDELCLYTNDGVEIERAALGSEHGVTYHTHFMNLYGNPEKAYHNALAVRGAALYLLGPLQLWRARLLPWRDRIRALQNAGDWMGAFHIAMEIYDGRSQGVTGLPRGLDAMREAIMPTLLDLLSAYIDEAFAYLSLALGSTPSTSSIGFESNSKSQKDLGRPDIIVRAGANGIKDSDEEMFGEAREQYARVGGVAIEFCVHIRKTEVLFENVFSKFDAVGQRGTFLELLEPYILKDMLGGLAPEVMQALVEHYSSRGWSNRVEQCVLHMDIASLDFNQVVRVCRDHRLYSALIYLFNKGLDDFKSPLEELLAVAQQINDPSQAKGFGLKLLVYLKYCFSGLSFPPGNGTLSPARLPQLRTELLEYLLDVMESSKELVVSSEGLVQKYSRLLYLLTLDTQATLQVLGAAFPEDGPLGVGKRDCVYPLIRTKSEQDALSKMGELQFKGHSLPNQESIKEGLNLSQKTVDAVIHVLQAVQNSLRLGKESTNGESVTGDHWPSNKDIGDMFEFVAYFAAGRYAVVPAAVMLRVFEHLTSDVSEGLDKVENLEKKRMVLLRQREDLMLALLKAIPPSDWHAERALQLAQNVGFWQVTALLYAEARNYPAALESYLKDANRPQDPFSFVSYKLSPVDGLKGPDRSTFRECVLSHIPQLIQLSPVSTLVIVLKHFSNENQQILKGLAPHPRLLFNYMKAIMNIRSGGFGYSGTEVEKAEILRRAQHGEPSEKNSQLLLPGHRRERSQDCSFLESQANIADLLERSGIEFTDEMAEDFVELLCRFEAKSVLPFLESYENYRLEHCLRLCQEYGITDAAAFLLERVGDVASALSLVLEDVQVLLQGMDQAVAQFYSHSSSKPLLNLTGNEVLGKPEVAAVHSVVSDAVALCQRNTFRLEPRESETLWFRLLDRFVDPLRDLNMQIRLSKNSQQHHTLNRAKGQPLYNVTASKNLSNWKVLEDDLAAQTVRGLLVRYIGEIVNGMMGFVPISVTMTKILEDHGGHEFGDFKATILDMLSAYGYERAILGTAKQLIEDDIFQNIYTLRRGCSHAFAPSASICSVCGLLLDEPADPASLNSATATNGSKTSSSAPNNDKQKTKIDEESQVSGDTRLSVRVFPCGHATHFSCVEVDSGARKRTSSGSFVCPICSHRGKPVDFSPKAKDNSLLKTVIEVGAGKARDNNLRNLSQLGRTQKATNRIFGKSRLEILRQLESGTDLHELGPSMELSLAPPVLTQYKRPNSQTPPSSSSSSGKGNARSSGPTILLGSQHKLKSRAR